MASGQKGTLMRMRDPVLQARGKSWFCFHFEPLHNHPKGVKKKPTLFLESNKLNQLFIFVDLKTTLLQ